MKELAEAGARSRSASSSTSPASASRTPPPTSRPASTSRWPSSSPPSLGIDPSRRTSSGWRRSPTTVSRSSRTARVDLVLASYSITDERRQIVGQAGPYMITGQQLLVRADSDVEATDDLAGRGGLLGDGLHLARERQGRGHEAGRLRHLLRVRGEGARRHRPGDVDRRRDPRWATPRRTRASSRSSARSSPRSGSASATARTTRRCASGSTDVLRRPTTTATGPRPSRPRSASGRETPEPPALDEDARSAGPTADRWLRRAGRSTRRLAAARARSPTTRRTSVEHRPRQLRPRG